jgi:antitoxin (DNA-binding transcriptional repressor) of toxin-antitoxin stability system
MDWQIDTEMKTVRLTKNSSLKNLLDKSRNEEVLLTRRGHAVALVVPFDDDDAEWYARERDPAFIASIARAREQVKEGKVIRHEDLKRKLKIK